MQGYKIPRKIIRQELFEGEDAALMFKLFRAKDDLEMLRKYVVGYNQILRNLNLAVDDEASFNSLLEGEVYIIAAIATKTSEIVGGARLHKLTDQSLPIAGLIEHLDPNIHQFINDWRDREVVEICGLWNSLAISGLGIGSVHLIRIGIACVPHVGGKAVVTLCSPHTDKFSRKFGFYAFEALGNKGKFDYPFDRFQSTVNVHHDSTSLENADSEELTLIHKLRKFVNFEEFETLLNGQCIKFIYKLSLTEANEHHS